MTRSLPPLTTALLGAVLAAALSGCAEQVPAEAFGAQPSRSPDIVVLAVPSPTALVVPVKSGVALRTVDGVVLPDREQTPGNAFGDVTRAQLCEVHYSMGVRQPRFNDKVEAFGAYGISIRERDDYQVDRLIPVSLGGTNALTNLWPQPYAGRGAREKDELEAHLRRLVCNGRLDLRTAQRAIAADWSAAAAKYLLVPAPAEDPGYATGPDKDEPVDPFEVVNGGPCPKLGVSGKTRSKGIVFTCQRTGDGTLRWGKRY